MRPWQSEVIEIFHTSTPLQFMRIISQKRATGFELSTTPYHVGVKSLKSSTSMLGRVHRECASSLASSKSCQPWYLFVASRLQSTEESRLNPPSTVVMMNRGAAGAPSVSPALEKGADYANYFCTYAFLYHQKEMLSDFVRMDAYYSSVFQNTKHFNNKVVLDVGTGSGILAVWAAQAGARKVYAVEATRMAEHARQLAAGNGVEHIVEVIQGSIEDVELPEKVDVIISEWMGYFLIRESMFDSVIHARDKWLKPTGVMYPSHARMWVAPIRSGLGTAKLQEYEDVMADWDNFVADTDDMYGVDMSKLTNAFEEEQKKYYLQSALWNKLHPSQIIGTPFIIKEFDCLTATVQDVASVHSSFQVELEEGHSKISGFAGWFDVHFKGRLEDPADNIIELTTAPSAKVSTHWGQQVFLLHPPLDYEPGDILEGSIGITRSRDNHRLLDLKFSHRIVKSNDASSATAPFATSNFYLE